jgi:hypothetical protein
MRRLTAWLAIVLVAWVLPLQERVHEKRLGRIAHMVASVAANHGPEVVDSVVGEAPLRSIIKRTEPEDDYKPRIGTGWLPAAPRIAWSPGVDPPSPVVSSWMRGHPMGLAQPRGPPTLNRVINWRQHFNASDLFIQRGKKMSRGILRPAVADIVAHERDGLTTFVGTTMQGQAWLFNNGAPMEDLYLTVAEDHLEAMFEAIDKAGLSLRVSFG